MDKKLDKSTEQKILNAATAIFIREGYAGARMQAIADYAGMNKALLHYYFRSKDQLFQRIFQEKYALLMPRLRTALQNDAPFLDKMDKMVDAYIDLFTENPYLPTLIFSTINHHPEFLNSLPKSEGIVLMEIFNQAVERGEIKAFHPIQLFLSLVGLCALPYLAKPMVLHVMNVDEKNYQYLLEQRRPLIKTILRSSLAKT
jgi:TetR/AcrR family transcriptional regulator